MTSTVSGYVHPVLSNLSTKGARGPMEALPPPAELREGAEIHTPFDEVMSPADADAALTADTWQIPSTADREGYSGTRHFDWWLSGLRDMRSVLRECERVDKPFAPTSRVLEMGCASGRVLRHFAAQYPGSDVWGVDLNARHVEWIHRFLPGHIKAFQCTALPHLGLEDNYFDVVCAFSVFTHIDDLELAWIAELRRVLKPGGVAYITVHTDDTWDTMAPNWPIATALRSEPGAMSDFGPARLLLGKPMPADRVAFWWDHSPVYNCNVFHTRDYLKRAWGRFLDVKGFVRRGHTYQDVVVMVKP